MEKLETDITIDASPEAVWEILMDFSKFPEWNPFIVSIHGLQETGASLRVEMRFNGQKMTFKPTIITLQEPKVFEWLGALGFKGLFSGKHSFYLERIGDTKTLFKHSEEFRGWLLPFMWPKLKKGTRQGFEQMNWELKNRAEQAN